MTDLFQNALEKGGDDEGILTGPFHSSWEVWLANLPDLSHSHFIILYFRFTFVSDPNT